MRWYLLFLVCPETADQAPYQAMAQLNVFEMPEEQGEDSLIVTQGDPLGNSLVGSVAYRQSWISESLLLDHINWI